MPASRRGYARPSRSGLYHGVRPHRERDPAVRAGFTQQTTASDRDQPGGLSRPTNSGSARSPHRNAVGRYESELPTSFYHLPRRRAFSLPTQPPTPPSQSSPSSPASHNSRDLPLCIPLRNSLPLVVLALTSRQAGLKLRVVANDIHTQRNKR